jgi:cytochrome d ubiquinol oxidase subunit II
VACLAASIWATKLYDNYLAHPALFLVILLAVAALLLVKVFLVRRDYWKAWFSSSVTILGITFYGVIGLYPYMLPSSLDPAFGIKVHDAASSQLTLTIMLVLALIFVPIVIAYQIWVNRIFRHPVTEDDLGYEEAY